MRVASVFDRADPQGRPYFSPDRRRIVGRPQRARLVRYLTTAPMVMRAHGLEPDPLSGRRRQVVPLHYRSDGTWVWQQASAFYLREYGIAPELDLVGHIIAQRFAVPGRLPPGTAQAAEHAVLTAAPPGSMPWAAGAPPRSGRLDTPRYLVRVDAKSTVDAPSAIVRCLPDGRGSRVEALDDDLAWTPSDLAPSSPDFVEASERHVSHLIDQRWQALASEEDAP